MLVLTKNKYKNSKHYLLVYYGLKEAVFDCRRIRPSTTDCYYNRIQSFDNLIEIENYIKSISFIELTYKLKIFCIEQLRILVGTDTKNLKYSLNKYQSIIENEKINNEKNCYIFCGENIIFIEELITYKEIQNINKGIKLYRLKR